MIEPRMVWSDDLQRVLANFPIELARIDTNYGGFVKIAVINTVLNPTKSINKNDKFLF